MIIQIENLSKVYDTGKIQVTALRDVSFEVNEREYLAVMGASGSGKSTLMNILGCLDRLTAGKYILGGQDVSTMEDDALAVVRNKKIGFVFQAFNLLPRLTALDNVVLPMMYAGFSHADRITAAKQALKRVGLEDRMDHRPNELSGGQKQRVAIARALVNNPAIILADEPTGNLDTKSSEEIMEIFEGLNNDGATILMVTHEHDIAMHTKRSIIFRDGQIISDKLNENRILRGGSKV